MVNGLRLYTTPAGLLPSVVTVLSATKSVADRAGLARWRRSVGKDEAAKILAASAERGTALHSACEAYMRDGIVGSGVWWDSVRPFLGRITRPELIEAKVWHPRGFAGSLDLCACVDNTPAIVDFKTARKRKRREWITDYCMQVSAYVAGANHVYRTMCGRSDKIRSAWITVAYEDAPADEFELTERDIVGYYKAFCGRLDEFNASHGRIIESAAVAPGAALADNAGQSTIPSNV